MMATEKLILKRGLLVTIEGLDRTGKSTQSARLLEHIKNKYEQEGKKIAFPNRESESGKTINKYLTDKEFKMSDEEIHELFALNRKEMKEEMLKLLRQKTSIVCDRYAYSGVAYSSAKGLNFQWCKKADKGFISPDLVFYIELNPEKLQSRSGFGEERYEVEEFQIKVAKMFNRLKEENLSNIHWKTIIGDDKDIDQISREIQGEFDRYVENDMEKNDLEKLKDSLFVE